MLKSAAMTTSVPSVSAVTVQILLNGKTVEVFIDTVSSKRFCATVTGQSCRIGRFRNARKASFGNGI